MGKEPKEGWQIWKNGLLSNKKGGFGGSLKNAIGGTLFAFVTNVNSALFLEL